MPRNSLAENSPRSDVRATNRRGVHKVKKPKISDHTTRASRRRYASRGDISSQLQIKLCTCRKPDTCRVEDSQYCIGCGRPVGMESDDSLTAETSVTTPGVTPLPKADGYGLGTETRESFGEEEEQAEVDWEKEEQIFEDEWFTPILPPREKSALRLKPKEIRLLQIAPGHSADPISCTRIKTALPNAIFEAVSYTWADETGNGEYSESVTCDGTESWVTRNGASLLRCVRLTDRVRTIWMDQLCINQSDNYEKSWQVQLMPEIYEKAEEVFIFAAPELIFPDYRLGDDRHLKDKDFLNILQLRWFSRVWALQEVARAKRVSVLTLAGNVPRSVLEEKSFIIDANDEAERIRVFKKAARDAAEQILITDDTSWGPSAQKISYFYRTWGYTSPYRRSIPWELFRSKILEWHQKLSSNVKAKAGLPGALNLQMQKLVSHKDLHSLLLLTRSTCSGDPRDKVFALFGIVINAAEHGLVADYAKTTELVFTETAWYIIRTTNTLEVLSTRHDGTSSFQIASWVTDWTKPSRRSLRSDLRNRSLWDGAHLTDYQPRFHHTLLFGDLAPSFQCNCNTGELQLKGHFLAKVISINKSSLSDNIASSSNEVPMVTPPSLEAGTDCSLSLNYWDQWAKMSDRPSFRTKNSAGFSESQPEIGDEVWQLHGADILFVLRKHEHAYKLISECFLWGMSYHLCCWEDNCERFLDDGSRVCAGCLRFCQIGLHPPVDITIC